jgi:uncharacterized LabA/DUF88 family protein
LSKNVAVFVDVANLYYSARGLEVDVDYVALLKAATKGRDLIRAYAYSGLDPENENQRKFIDFLGKNDYKVVHKDIRKFGDGRVKANLDIELVVDLFRLADRMDIAVIVSGDGDFAPAIRALQDKGVRCEVISFRPNTSSDLIAVADEFIDIMKIIGIGRGKDADKASKVMSAPPMPAKEVVPEFGFREAPAAVAAAALAAIREGGAKPASRGRGRGGARPEPSLEAMAPGTEEPPEAPTAAEAAADGATGEARRRRRRRGGRGRGRGRGRTDEVTADAPPAAEAPIGWTELDDISQAGQADADENREYSFEEADAETLAELGLLPTDVVVAAPEPEAPAEEAPKPRRGRKPAERAAAPETAEAPKPRQGRARAGAAPKATSVDASASASPRARGRTSKAKSDETAEAAAPKPRTRARSKPASTSDAEPAPAEGAEEGIWQRFRGARTKAP